MSEWQGVGYIGYDDDEVEDDASFFGAAEEVYDGAMEEYAYDGLGRRIKRPRRMMRRFAPRRRVSKRVYSPRAVSKRAPKIAVPAALSKHLSASPIEVFDIYPGYPNAIISTAIVANALNVESVVHTFTPPTGHYVIINPSDITQEVLFEPFATSDSTGFIRGLINIYTRTGLMGFQQRLYSASSEYHNPAVSQSSVGNRRRWQFGAVISPGDLLETRFIGAVANIVGSHLDHRVTIKKITP